MNDADRKKWDSRYRLSDTSPTDSTPPEPSTVLTEYSCLLPEPGANALDLACGLGGNALELATRGLRTFAWDISANAIERVSAMAGERNLPVTAETRDVEIDPPAPRSFDVIVVSRYLYRPLCPALVNALRSGGLLYYQTFVKDHLSDNYTGPGNPDYLLDQNELLSLFDGLTVRAYLDLGTTGNPQAGFRNESLLVAQRLS